MQTNKQEAKADAGKPQLTLVPRQILFDIAEVRAFGVKKYGDPDNWKKVEIQRYRDAAFRHFMAYLEDPQGNDEESGLPHLAHLACNIAFLCELEKILFGGASNITDDEAQTIDAEPVKHAYWEEKQDMNGDTYYHCTNCKEGFVLLEGTPKDNLYYYCPNCGAKMETEE